MCEQELKQLKKMHMISTIGICLFAFLCAVTCMVISSVKESEIYKDTAENKYTKSIGTASEDFIKLLGSQSENEALYKLGEFDGKIAIYDCQKDEISDILDVYAFTLPESDRLALENGIYIYSDDELLGIVEDFTG